MLTADLGLGSPLIGGGVFMKIWLAALAVVCCAVGCNSFAGEAAPALEAYGALPAFDHMTLSSSGDKLAYISVEGEKRTLIVRKLGGDVLAATALGKNKIRDVWWAGDDYVLVELSGTWRGSVRNGRYEVFNVLVLNPTKQKLSYVFGKSDAAISGRYGDYRINGQWYGFFTALGDSYWGLQKVNFETGGVQTVPNAAGAAVFGTDGAILAHVEYRSDDKEWDLYAGATSHTELLSKKDPLGEMTVLGQGRTPGTVLVADSTGEEDVLEEVSLTKPGPPVVLLTGKLVQRVIFDPVTQLFVGVETPEGPILFDPVLQARFDGVKKAFPNYRVTLASVSAGFNGMIVETDGSDDSGTYWHIDLTTGKATDLQGAYPSIDQAHVAPTRKFSYKAADGLALEGILTLPVGRRPEKLPVVVMPHGGPVDVYDKISFDWWAQAFASRGYAVFQPNYRGSGGYGAALRKAGMGEWGRKMQSDITDGLRALAAAGVVDDKRTCIVGASYGGYSALWGVIFQRGVYRCAVAVAGVSDVGQVLWDDTGPYAGHTRVGRFMRKLTGATYAADPALRAISPVYHAEDADAPILIIQGTDDTVVGVEQSTIMLHKLQEARKAVAYVELKDDDHWLSQAGTRTLMVASSVAFVEKHNPPD
jgi:dipeptidyl aminopeptidase/acylaminoacyl peptidase